MTPIKKSHWEVGFSRPHDKTTKVVMIPTRAPAGERGDGVPLNVIMAAAIEEFPDSKSDQLYLFEMKHLNMLLLTKGRYSST